MLDFLKRYAASKTVRFHMPGHKGKIEEEALGEAAKLDITEIEGSDNLQNPEGIILESQRRAAKLFGSRETIYLVNGSTSGIYAAITGSIGPGEKLLLQRNSHGAAYNAVVLGDIDTEYIYPEYSEELGLPLGIDIVKLERALDESPDIRVVFVTSPSYYGICLDLESIAKAVHDRGAILIVDEAHGSHLSMSDGFPKSAVQSGADMVVQSTHKTLLGMTQTAMLHINSDRVDSNRVKKMARMYQSTSPSYVLMASIDHTVTYLSENRERIFEDYLGKLEAARQSISSIAGVKLLGEGDIPRGTELDKSKIVFSVEGIPGKKLERELRSRGIELEMSDFRYGVALSTFMDSEDDLKSLAQALEDISLNVVGRENETVKVPKLYSEVPEKNLSQREAFYSEAEKTKLKDSVGKTVASAITPYPPGIPLLVPGEVVEEDTISCIETLIDRGYAVLGVSDGKIDTIREV
ncbi:arginine decarboxylase [Andreesenia angusta]|uniref:Arginine decarboxylase n=1 Tax=Andreesenia angusta TaxID=39480 RepID=A0A1S1V4K8_9FIRM|nr:aminotransferase class I/II-fold pyridoxal phosphate-dependent enzyme [Andreesenia angusta]OHW61458.1 arginine decarboxylase [Andreesenia angusta]